ncbi:MAG: hypothetical protein HOH36_16400 [Acidimicrobiaceae bacterium]|jgi:hypothetical protein|nr:hypothetical protein [Acidimicrobiaceae bacterium]MBT5579476.1 hypothetical protein [Acidimicrobiaceae bacterium]MBT5852009.1 hypothetical protein [Acidimicrobiaceae bacterium]
MIEAFAHLEGEPLDPAVVLVAQAAYHLDELLPLAGELRRRGIPVEVCTPVPPESFGRRFRPSMRRHRGVLAAAGSQGRSTETFDSVTKRALGLVVMNDWGLTRSLVDAVSHRGVPTFGWVEGVQDFDDVDTGRDRAAYRSVSHVFCLGEFGANKLTDCDVTTVGSSRLRKIWAEPPVDNTSDPMVTINSNFTYGVFTDARRPWGKDAVGACRESERPFTLSRHEAERGLSLDLRARHHDVSALLLRSTHLISRFSTLGYEALVRGVHLVYHNPHGEKVDTFTEVPGAISTVADQAGLVSALQGPLDSGVVIRKRAQAFLNHHLRLGGAAAPAELAADVVERSL